MTIQDYEYTHSQAEFDEMCELLVYSYTVSKKPFNWRLAQAENWNHASRYLEPLEYFTSRVHLWRDAAGALVSFLIRYYDTTYLQVHPDHRYVEARMLQWAERNWAGAKARISTMGYDHDSQRQRLLAQRGYKDLGVGEHVRIYDLAKTYPEAVLPPGFRFATLAELGDAAGRIVLENSIWSANLDAAWLKGKQSAPHYALDWDLVVLAPGGQQVAASLVWIYPRNGSAEIDPLGTHPHYRRRGLARAIITESFRRMQARGLRYAYITANPANQVVNHLYASFQPVETYYGHDWVKRLD